MHGSVNYGDIPEAAESGDRKAIEALAEILDSDHMKKLRIAEQLLGVSMNDVYSRFVVEELRGVFDSMDDGLQMIPWLEEASDFFRISNSTFFDCYEKCEYELDPTKAKAFEAYRSALESEYQKQLVEEAMNLGLDLFTPSSDG